MAKPLLEATLALSPNGLIRCGSLSGTVNGFVSYDIDLQLQEIHVAYLLADGTAQDYTLELDWTPCNFGGGRWWIRCWCCGIRRRALYLPPNRPLLLCRICGRLSYRSQLMQPIPRAALASQKLSARFPIPRPTGMWRRTHLAGLAARANAEDTLWRLMGVDSIEASSRSGLLLEMAQSDGPPVAAQMD